MTRKGTVRVDCGVAALLILLLAAMFSSAQAQNTLVVPAGSPYVPGPYPDRIVLTPTATPHNSQAVSWRTKEIVSPAIAEIAVAGASPNLSAESTLVYGRTQALLADNGLAHHHQVQFANLSPDTLYAYRVGGADTWSEWFQFRTASAEPTFPFQVIYFGDAQNSVKSLFSRVIRQGILMAPDTRLFIHAGDLIDRAGRLDDHWGEWFDAGSWMSASINNMVVPGNHEYDESASPVALTPHWQPQFATAGNGPAELPDTVFYTEYQGVMFISLDSTQAVHHEEMAVAQAQWLQGVLAGNTNRWTVVSYHHPMFSVSHGVENPNLQRHWRPLFERYGVDMVLQGHDHVYGRGQNLTSGTSGQPEPSGPVYLVSVAGPKMNLVSDPAEQVLTLTGEDVQLFQILTFGEDRIRYESRTAIGTLYDAFDLVRRDDGSRVLEERGGIPASRRVCSNRSSVPATVDSDGRARPGRCWDGFSWP